MQSMEFEKFTEQLQTAMPQLVEEILSHRPGEKVYGIAFVTTDDFYGMYAAFETREVLQSLGKRATGDRRWYPTEWGYSDTELPTSFDDELYENLVAVVEADEEIDFSEPSKEKWDFAVKLMQAVRNAIDAVPDAVFEKCGYKRQEIIFLATMSDGDYIEEMLLESARTFNKAEAASEIISYLGKH